MIQWEYVGTMCEEARSLMAGYLDALEDYDRLHLIFLAAYRRGDAQAVDNCRQLLQDGKQQLESVRAQFREHGKSHGCTEAIRFDEDLCR